MPIIPSPSGVWRSTRLPRYLHGVVQVHPLQVPESHHAFQLRERLVAGLRRPQVVSGGEGVAGVDADPHARFVLHPLDQVGQMFEGEPEVRTLSGRVFDHGRHAAGLVQCDVDRLGDQVERLVRAKSFAGGCRGGSSAGRAPALRSAASRRGRLRATSPEPPVRDARG